jgi:hypothetical protein
MKFNLCKHNGKAIPATDEDQKKFQKIGEGEVFTCKSVDQRSIEFHRKFFALIRLAFDNMPERFDNHFPDPDDLRKELLILGGFYSEYTDFRGNTVKVPESMAFDKMGAERFEQVYNKTLDLVCRLIGVEESDVLDQLMEFM